MNKFDKEIRDKLHNYQSPIPANMWDKISKELPEKAKPFPWMMFGITIMVLFLGSLGLYYTYSDYSQPLLKSQTHSASIKMPDPSNKLIQTGFSMNEKKQVKVDNEAAITRVASRLVGNNIPIITNESKQTKTTRNNRIVTTTTEKTTTTNHFLKHAEGSNTIRHNSESISDEVEREVITFDTEKNGNSVVTLYDQYNSIFKKTRLRNLVQGLDKTPTLINGIQTEENLALLGNMKGKLNYIATTCPTFKSPFIAYTIDGAFSSDIALSRYELAGNTEGEQYLRLRKETEQMIYSFSGGVRLGVMTSTGFGVRSGIYYGQSRFRFQYEDPEHKKQKTIITREYIWENGNIVDSIEKVEVIDVPGVLTTTAMTSLRTIDVPLIMSYEWPINNRMSVSIAGGPMFNVSFRSIGKIINPTTLKPQELKELDRPIFKTNIGASLYLATALHVHLGNGLSVFAEPNYRGTLNSVSSINSSVQQKLKNFGIGIGMRQTIGR